VGVLQPRSGNIRKENPDNTKEGTKVNKGVLKWKNPSGVILARPGDADESKTFWTIKTFSSLAGKQKGRDTKRVPKPRAKLQRRVGRRISGRKTWLIKTGDGTGDRKRAQEGSEREEGVSVWGAGQKGLRWKGDGGKMKANGLGWGGARRKK